MFGFFGPPGGGAFEARYRAMPLAFIDKQSAEFGDKVILPPSALDRLASLHIEYPMLFKVEGVGGGRATHCGVLEFVAEEGVVYMPHWMMQNMLLEVGDMVKVRNVALPKGTYVKLQPVTSDFLDISNPKAVLERTLRAYTCLTVGDVFVVHYNGRTYELEVKEAKPGAAVSVVETDCQVDFEAPKDYKEPERVTPPAPPPIVASERSMDAESARTSAAHQGRTETGAAGDAPEEPTFLAFAGSGRRLDGRPSSSAQPVPVRLSGRQSGSTSVAGGGGGGGAGSSPAASGSAASGHSKPGTFVSTGNRLLDKLAREQAQKSGTGTSPSPLPPPAAVDPTKPDKSPVDAKAPDADPGPSFKAFTGKGYSLKG